MLPSSPAADPIAWAEGPLISVSAYGLASAWCEHYQGRAVLQSRLDWIFVRQVSRVISVSTERAGVNKNQGLTNNARSNK